MINLVGTLNRRLFLIAVIVAVLATIAVLASGTVSAVGPPETPGGGSQGTTLQDIQDQISQMELDLSAQIAQIGNNGQLQAQVTQLVNDSQTLQTQVADLQGLVVSTHLVDPYDMSVTMCATYGPDAEISEHSGLDTDFVINGGVGIDYFGNGVSIDYETDFSHGIYTDIGAGVNLELEACMNGIFYRQDGSADSFSTTDLLGSEIDLINELFAAAGTGSAGARERLRTRMTSAASSFTEDLSVDNLEDAILVLQTSSFDDDTMLVDNNIANPFTYAHDGPNAYKNILPIPEDVRKNLGNSFPTETFDSLNFADPTAICGLFTENPHIASDASSDVAGLCDLPKISGEAIEDAFEVIADLPGQITTLFGGAKSFAVNVANDAEIAANSFATNVANDAETAANTFATNVANSAQTAAESFATIAADDALTASYDYADSAVDGVETAANTFATNVANSAQTAAESFATIAADDALTVSYAYADSAVDGVETAANAFATNVANSAQAAAEVFAFDAANAVREAAADHAIAAADQAQAAAESFATNAADFALEAVYVYADSAAGTALNTANAFATNAADFAEETAIAWSYATIEQLRRDSVDHAIAAADQAQTAAESFAETFATNAADFAEETAIAWSYSSIEQLRQDSVDHAIAAADQAEAAAVNIVGNWCAGIYGEIARVSNSGIGPYEISTFPLWQGFDLPDPLPNIPGFNFPETEVVPEIYPLAELGSVRNIPCPTS